MSIITILKLARKKEVSMSGITIIALAIKFAGIACAVIALVMMFIAPSMATVGFFFLGSIVACSIGLKPA